MKSLIEKSLKNKLILGGFLGIIFLFFSLRITSQIDYPNTDFFSYWLGARMIVEGQNPYDEPLWIESHHTFGATWISDRAYLYPLPLAILTSPIGFFPLKQAFTIWCFLSLVMFLLSLITLFKLWKRSDPKPYLFPVIAGFIFFRPAILTLAGGQLGALLLLILCLSLLCFEKDKWFAGGLLIALLALKPNTGILLILLIVLWLLRIRKAQALAGIVISGILLFLMGWFYNQQWVINYLFIGNRKVNETFGYSPTVWGMASGFCYFQLNCVIWLGGLFSILMIGVCLFLLYQKHYPLPPSLAFSLIIITVLLITPYLWTYDHILLVLPLLTAIRVFVEKKMPFLFTGSLFLILDLIAMAFLLITIQIEKEIWNGVIPLTCLGFIVWAIFIQLGKSHDATKKSI
jgi:hypothetical protein